jgi:hypothetical protein
MDYVDDYTHDYDPVLVDSDYDQSFRGVSSPSYSAYDSEEGDLEMVEDLETLVTFMMVIDLETTLQIYQDLSNAECDL